MSFNAFAIPGVIAAAAFWFINEKYAFYSTAEHDNEELEMVVGN